MIENNKTTIVYALQNSDWSDLTVRQIAEVLDSTSQTIYRTFSYLRERGVFIEYKKKKQGRPRKFLKEKPLCK